MATGDNGLTAVSVGRKCGIFDSHKDAFLGDVDVNADSEAMIKWTKIKLSQEKDRSFVSNNQSDSKLNKTNKIQPGIVPDEDDENGKIFDS